MKEEEECLDSDDDEDDLKMTPEDNPEDDQNIEKFARSRVKFTKRTLSVNGHSFLCFWLLALRG